MTAITQDDFRRFSSDVQRTATMLDNVGPLGMLRAAANLLLMEHRGNKAISLARAMFEACAHACETAPCVKGIQETALTVRDSYLLLADLVPRLPVVSLLKGRVSRSLMNGITWWRIARSHPTRSFETSSRISPAVSEEWRIEYLKPFDSRLKEALKKFSRSEKSVRSAIESLAKNPTQGDAYPGFGKISVRKIRIPLPEYKIGKSGGLRLIYMALPDKKKILPLVVYKKGTYASEHEVTREINQVLREIRETLDL